MINFIIHFLVLGALIWVISMIVPGMRLKNIKAALVVGIVYSILNWLLYLFFWWIALPFKFLTLGLASVVFNAVLLKLTDDILDDFELAGWKSAFIAGACISVANLLLAASGI